MSDKETVLLNEIDYRVILESISDGVYYTDKNRRIEYWSPGAERISGYTASDVVGSYCWNNILLHIDKKGHGLCKTDKCPLVQSISEDKFVTTEAYLHHKNGHRVPVAIKTMPVKDKTGEIVGAVELFTENANIEALQDTVKTLEQSALTDSLTCLANRRHLETVLDSQFNLFNRYATPCGLIFMDIDNFKNLNDEHGHDIGDKALKTIANTLISNLRSFDLPARWGGEEFAVISTNAGIEDVAHIAEKTRLLIENSTVNIPDKKISLTVSVGATVIKKDDTPESLFKRADQPYVHKQRERKESRYMRMKLVGIFLQD